MPSYPWSYINHKIKKKAKKRFYSFAEAAWQHDCTVKLFTSFANTFLQKSFVRTSKGELALPPDEAFPVCMSIKDVRELLNKESLWYIEPGTTDETYIDVWLARDVKRQAYVKAGMFPMSEIDSLVKTFKADYEMYVAVVKRLKESP